MLCAKIVLNVIKISVLNIFSPGLRNNLSPYCGLVDAKIRASDKDLPVLLRTLRYLCVAFTL